MWTSSWDERLHNWRKESTTSTLCVTARTHTLGPAAAPAQLCQGKLRPCPEAGKASLMHVPFGVVQILSHTELPALPWICSWAQQSTAVSGRKRAIWQMEPGPVTAVHEQTSAPSHSSFLWFPESQTAFSTNKQPSKATWEQAQAGHLPEGRTLYCKVKSH